MWVAAVRFLSGHLDSEGLQNWVLGSSWEDVMGAIWFANVFTPIGGVQAAFVNLLLTQFAGCACESVVFWLVCCVTALRGGEG